MKKRPDLSDPLVKKAVAAYEKIMHQALGVPQTVESAVLPIYWRTKPNTKPEQVASGVVVNIETEYFVFSASHVFDDIGQYGLLMGMGDGSPLVQVMGDRFSSAKGPSGKHCDDLIDASVFHIKSEVPDNIKKLSLTLDDFDLNQPDETSAVFLSSGFRVKISKTLVNSGYVKRECFPSLELGDHNYSLLNIDKKTHLALSYEDEIVMNGRWQQSPIPKGFSGGAIIKVQGVSSSTKAQTDGNIKQLLSAIIIAHGKERDNKPGMLIGTRIGVHLELIENYLPGLLKL